MRLWLLFGSLAMGEAAKALGFPLSEVSVRPVRDAAERAEWDRVMDDGRHLGFRGMFGGGIRHVAAGPDGEWLALLGWCAGAFKARARDAWIGWAPERQCRRLRLVANNRRFLVLPRGRVANLASRVLGLAARRVSADMEAAFGHPALLAETFADPSRFNGGCCLAAGWTPVGRTRGFARAGGGWVEHGRPKEVFVRPLAADARSALGGLDEPASWGCGRAVPEPPSPGRMRSLFDHLRQVPEFRSPRGLRHSLASVLAVAAAAKLAGAQGPAAIAEFAARLDQRRLAAVRAFRSPTAGRLTPPSRASVHRILSSVDPDALDAAARAFAAARQAPEGALAIDGKSAPLSRPGGPDDGRMPLAAVAHGSGLIVGRNASDSGGGEIPGARRLIRELDVAGRVLTLDALHSCPRTARLIVAEGADYVMPVKSNRQELLEDLRAFDWGAAPTFQTLEKGHGRIERRACAVIPLDGVDAAPLPGRRQAFRILRERTVTATGAHSVETAHGLTSLPPKRAGPSEVLALNRGHWEIENRVHYVRDFSYDEDRSRVRSGKLPRNLACLSNAAISIVRLRGRFRHQPQAHRHCAARQGEAVREVLAPKQRRPPRLASRRPAPGRPRSPNLRRKGTNRPRRKLRSPAKRLSAAQHPIQALHPTRPSHQTPDSPLPPTAL